MIIKLKLLTKTAKLPERMTEFSAGYDIYADSQENIDIETFQRVLISTGFSIALPEGYEAQIRPRSGLALNNGISVLNSPGTIDSDYRGEVKVILINLSNDKFTIKPGMRIAQMVVAKHEKPVFKIVEDIDDTTRGTNGFGSSS